jgi:hypothetical protein
MKKIILIILAILLGFYLLGPLLVLVGYVIVLVKPLWVLAIVALFFVAYYLYDNFIKKESNSDLVSLENNFKSSQSELGVNGLKLAILIGIIILIVVYCLMILSSSGDKTGHYDALGFLIIPMIPIAFIFYPIYFGVLAIRYTREKSNMNVLDKITFYIILTCLIVILIALITAAIKLNMF